MLLSWLPLGLLAGLAMASAFPMFDDEEFEEIKKALENTRGNSFFGTGDDYYYDGKYPERSLGVFQPGYKSKEYEEADEERRRELLEGAFTVTRGWPSEAEHIGQVGGVAVDNTPDENVHVFHRASRIWDVQSFYENNSFVHRTDGPIADPTLLVLSRADGKVLHKSGANRFYMPHGLTIDHEGNRWVTDVALHQVFKIPAGKEEPSLTLGEPFVKADSNDDKNHFCQPTDVAVMKNGDFFVADGYCNSRVMKFNKDGKYIGQVNQYDDMAFVVPHNLALVEELDYICVADRDNGRIACYNAGIAQPAKFGEQERMYEQISPGEPLGRIFAIEFDEKDGLLYAAGMAPDAAETPVAYTIDILEHEKYDKWPSDVINEWAPTEPDDQGNEFEEPHDIAISPSGRNLYMGLVDPQSKKKKVPTATLR